MSGPGVDTTPDSSHAGVGREEARDAEDARFAKRAMAAQISDTCVPSVCRGSVWDICWLLQTSFYASVQSFPSTLLATALGLHVPVREGWCGCVRSWAGREGSKSAATPKWNTCMVLPVLRCVNVVTGTCTMVGV